MCEQLLCRVLPWLVVGTGVPGSIHAYRYLRPPDVCMKLFLSARSAILAQCKASAEINADRHENQRIPIFIRRRQRRNLVPCRFARQARQARQARHAVPCRYTRDQLTQSGLHIERSRRSLTMDDKERAEHDRFLLGGEAKENRKRVRRPHIQLTTAAGQTQPHD